MKTFLPAAFLFFVYANVYAQCPEPEVLNWQFSSAEAVQIVASFPEGTTAYVIHFVALYDDGSGAFSPDTLTFSESSDAGTHVFDFDPTPVIPWSLPLDSYFYETLLQVQCASGAWSDTLRFYVSPFSLLNDPIVACSQPFTNITYLSDDMLGFPVPVEIEVGVGDPSFEVENISVLVDIGHTYSSDLSISITSPAGTTAALRSFTIPIGMHGLSILFVDGAPPIDSNTGVYSPDEPLSIFDGEEANGTWTLNVTDMMAADYGYVFGGCININTSPCLTGISGKAFYDLNLNGSPETDEPTYGNALLISNLGDYAFFTNSIGDFLQCTDEGPVSISLANDPPYFSSTPSSHDLDLTSEEMATGLNFALVPVGSVVDLFVDLYAAGPDRPGFSNSYYVSCTNLGNTCIDNVSLELELDALLSFDSLTGGTFTLSVNMATVDIGTLCPMGTVLVEVFHSLPDTVSLGTELSSTATLFPLEGDENADDNTSNLRSIVVGSFDPNDKQVNRAEIDADFLDAGDYLTYHVRFQNTGTYYAERVVISDTISDFLDFNTFELLGVSHDVELSNDGHHIDFTFDNIFLPDSTTNEPESHGYVRYRIKPLAGFSPGDIITNTAYIYFDFNEPIVTNTVMTVWGSPLGVSAYAIRPEVYPNPTTTILNIRAAELSEANSYAVYSLIGKEMKQGVIRGGQETISIPIEDLGPGVYILHLEGDRAFQPVRWVKM